MENFELPRGYILDVLNAIGIKIPRDTKLKTDRLRHRLERCLDAAQRYRNLFGDENAIVDPASYPLWEEHDTIVQGLDRRIWGGIDLGITTGAFYKMCRSIVTLGEKLNMGVREVVLTDRQASAIAIKIHEVHAVGENRPLLVVGFAVIVSTRKVGIKRATENFYAATNRSQADTVHVFPDEQSLLLQLLKQNQSRLSSRFVEEVSDSQYTASFILPTSWLAMEDLGRLGKTTGCFVCGEPTRWECVRCRSVQYCGKEDCQRQHWNDHRSICRAISSGAWHTVVLDRFPGNTGMESASIYTINRYDDLDDKPTGEEVGTGMPPNTHGDKYYLVKLQMPLGGQSSHILVYDQQKSFQLFIRKDLNPDIFDEAVRAFGGWPKMYRWTQRVGDREWRMCFDQVPGIDPHW